MRSCNEIPFLEILPLTHYSFSLIRRLIPPFFSTRPQNSAQSGICIPFIMDCLTLLTESEFHISGKGWSYTFRNSPVFSSLMGLMAQQNFTTPLSQMWACFHGITQNVELMSSIPESFDGSSFLGEKNRRIRLIISAFSKVKKYRTLLEITTFRYC